MREIDREILTSLGRLLAVLYQLGGKAPKSKLRKYIGSQIYTAALKASAMGLVVVHQDDSFELTEKGKQLGECISKCFPNLV